MIDVSLALTLSESNVRTAQLIIPLEFLKLTPCWHGWLIGTSELGGLVQDEEGSQSVGFVCE